MYCLFFVFIKSRKSQLKTYYYIKPSTIKKTKKKKCPQEIMKKKKKLRTNAIIPKAEQLYIKLCVSVLFAVNTDNLFKICT